MPFNHITFKQLKGLHLQANSFSLPEGCLEEATNVVCAQDSTIIKRRGYYLFASPATTSNAMFFYSNTLMLVLSNAIARIDLSGTITNLTGDTVDTSNITSRSEQSNSNLYFTSNNGIMKIESPTSAVFKSGVAPGLDLQAYFTTNVGPIAPDTQVAYRIVFGRTDDNENLLLSAPSDILILANRNFESNASESAGTVTVTQIAHGLTSGDAIIITTSTGAGTPLTGTRIVNVTDADHFTFADGAASGITTLTWGVSKKTSIEASIPSEVNSTSYFYQIYRTTQSATQDTSPQPNFRLVVQTSLTSADLANGLIIYVDNIDDLFLGAELYTNPNSQEGELQANTRAPLALDMALFKNFMFYANTISRHKLLINLASSSSVYINNGDKLLVKQGLTTRTYTARSGVGNMRVTGTAITNIADITVHYVAHGLVTGDTIFVSGSVGTGNLPDGSHSVTVIDADNFKFAFVATGTVTSLDFQAVTNLAGERLFTLVGASPSVAAGIQRTSQALVKAINRDASSVIYARYISGFNDVPGKMAFEAKGFGAPFYLNASSTAFGNAFSPTIPTSGLVVISTDDVLPNGLFIGKEGEPEAVPTTNFIAVGAKNAAILRVAALRDSLLILKEDGIYRLNGDNITNFVVTVLDNTVFCKAANSVAVLNNQVYCLSNQGIVQITDTSASIESRSIELPITAVLGASNLGPATAGVAYESDRLYVLTTIAPNQTSATTVYVYNYITREWTQWDTLFKAAIVGPGDALHYLGLDGKVYKERKLQTKIDYCGQDYPLTVSSVSTDKLTVVFAGTAVIPQAGDIVVKAGVINRITRATIVGATVVCTFRQGTNFLAADVVTLYSQYVSRIKFAPIDAGTPHRAKQFSVFQVAFRNLSCTNLTVFFANEKFAGSESIVWDVGSQSVKGWGLEPWGLFPFGDSELINLEYTTGQCIELRTYIPRFAARGIFIQPVLQHSQAAEAFIVQSIGFAVRGYGERTVR